MSKPQPPANRPTQAPAPAPEQTDEERLRAQVERAVGDVVPQKARAQIVGRVQRILVEHSELFTGPIAHPEHLEHYDRICPGAADRIIKMAEREQEARISFTEKEQENDANDRTRGLRYGLVAFALMVAAALGACYLSYPLVGSAFLAAGMIGVIAHFINGRN